MSDPTATGASGLEIVAWNPRGDSATYFIYPMCATQTTPVSHTYSGLNVTLDLMPGDYFFRFRVSPTADLSASLPSVYTFAIQVRLG